MKFLGDTKVETVADTKVKWLILLQWLSSPTLHCILISCITLQPFQSFYHSGFQSPGQSSVSSISYSAYSMFPSPLLRSREPTRKCRRVHFCNFPSLSLSGSSFLGPCWNRGDGNKMENSDITDLHGVVVAFSWSRRTDLKFPLTDKHFPCGVSL